MFPALNTDFYPRRRNVTNSIVGFLKKKKKKKRNTGPLRKNLTRNGEPHSYSWENSIGRRIGIFSTRHSRKGKIFTDGNLPAFAGIPAF